MDNPETMTKLSTQDTGLRQIKHKKAQHNTENQKDEQH